MLAAHKIPSGDERWPAQGNCKPGWVKYARACYKVVGDVTSDPNFDQKATWSQANALCASEGSGAPGWQGGTLAVLPNVYYSYFLTALIKNNVSQNCAFCTEFTLR